MTGKMIDLMKLSPAERKEFRDKYDALFFDMDGCLVELEGPVIKGAQEALNEIRKNGKEVGVITDNCLNTLENISSRVHKLFPAIDKEKVFNTTYFLVEYLKDIRFSKKIYVIGGDGIISDLKNNGYEVVYDEGHKTDMRDLLQSIEGREEGIGAVAVAGDYNFNYKKLTKAVNYLASDPKVLLFQTHYPLLATYKHILPGVGSLMLPIKVASGRKESICSGKGGECSVKYMKSSGYRMDRTLFIGDGLANDVYFGNLCGMDTLLVLSGACSLGDVENAKKKNKNTFVPTYYTNSVADLFDIFKS